MGALVVAALALAALLALALLMGRNRGGGSSSQPRPAEPPSHPVPASQAQAAGPGLPAGTSSVAAAITAFDLATSEAGRYNAEQHLAQLGVWRLPVQRGDPVDPAVHNVVERRSDPALLPGTVAAVVRPGWGSSTGMLRPSDVSVTG